MYCLSLLYPSVVTATYAITLLSQLAVTHYPTYNLTIKYCNVTDDSKNTVLLFSREERYFLLSKYFSRPSLRNLQAGQCPQPSP